MSRVKIGAGFSGTLNIPEATGIVWDPTGDGDVTTWAEVFAAISVSKSPIDVYIKGVCDVPASLVPYETNGVMFRALPILGPNGVNIADGAVLKNVGGVYGLCQIRGHQTAGPCLVFDSAPPSYPNLFTSSFNGILSNYGTGPMIAIPDAAYFVWSLLFNGEYQRSASQPLFGMGAGSVLVIGCYGPTTVPDDFAIGPGSAFIVWENVLAAPSPLPTNAGFTGTTVQVLITGASCTGPATRPVSPFSVLPKGASVFDESLGKPIWWNGAAWVDATGAVV